MDLTVATPRPLTAGRGRPDGKVRINTGIKKHVLWRQLVKDTMNNFHLFTIKSPIIADESWLLPLINAANFSFLSGFSFVVTLI